MKRWLKATCSVGFLVLAFIVLDWEGLKLALSRIDGWAFLRAALITLLIFVVLSVRWYRIIHSVVPLPLIEHLTFFFYATFLNSFTPANIAGDVYRWASLKHFAASSARILVALAKERVLGLLVYLFAYLACLPGLLHVVGQSAAANVGVFVVAGSVIFVAAVGIVLAPRVILEPLMRSKRVRSRYWLFSTVHHIKNAMSFDSWRDFAWLMACSAVGVVLWILAVHTVAVGLGMKTPLSVLGAIVVLTELIRLIPITIQGIGVREGMFAYSFVLLGESAEMGFVVGAISYLALTCAMITCGLIGWVLLQIGSQRAGR